MNFNRRLLSIQWITTNSVFLHSLIEIIFILNTIQRILSLNLLSFKHVQQFYIKLTKTSSKNLIRNVRTSLPIEIKRTTSKPYTILVGI